MLIALPSHMLKLMPPYTILHNLYIVFNLIYSSHAFKKQNPRWMKSDNTFVNHFSGVQPPIPILTRSLHGVGDSSACVCLQMSKWFLSVCVFILMFEEGGGHISRETLMLLVDFARIHSHTTPPRASSYSVWHGNH